MANLLKERYDALVARWVALPEERRESLLRDFVIDYVYNSEKIENEELQFSTVREIVEKDAVTSYTGDVDVLVETRNLNLSWDLARVKLVEDPCLSEELIQEAQGLLSVEAPAYLYITPREKDGKLLIHLFNLASENPLSPERPIVESVPQVGPVRVACPLAKEPRSVSLAPSFAPVDWTYANGMLRVRVERVHIHEILVVE